MKRNTKKNDKPQKVYAMIVRMLPDGSFDDPRFTFNATDDADADRKACSWKHYHGMSGNDVSFREAQGRELSWEIHNDYLR